MIFIGTKWTDWLHLVQHLMSIVLSIESNVFVPKLDLLLHNHIRLVSALRYVFVGNRVFIRNRSRCKIGSHTVYFY